MADPPGDSIVTLVARASESSESLHVALRSFHSQDKGVRALKDELALLNRVLRSLSDKVTTNPDMDFEALKPPLRRCHDACRGFAADHLQGDFASFANFKTMVAVYKSIIEVASASADIRNGPISQDAFEHYQDLLADTTHDLREHIQTIDGKMERRAIGQSGNETADEKTMREEQESTQRGLEICGKLSAQIKQTQIAPEEHRNHITDISLDNAFNLATGTAGYPVTARRIRLSGRSVNVVGQTSDESFQATIDALPKRKRVAQGVDRTESAAEERFCQYHGPGVRLSDGAKTS